MEISRYSTSLSSPSSNGPSMRLTNPGAFKTVFELIYLWSSWIIHLCYGVRVLFKFQMSRCKNLTKTGALMWSSYSVIRTVRDSFIYGVGYSFKFQTGHAVDNWRFWYAVRDSVIRALGDSLLCGFRGSFNFLMGRRWELDDNWRFNVEFVLSYPYSSWLIHLWSWLLI